MQLSRGTILAQMQELAKSLPKFSVVREMPCIGDTLAPRIIAEIDDVRRFNNKHSLMLILLPTVYSSPKIALISSFFSCSVSEPEFLAIILFTPRKLNSPVSIPSK